MKNTELHVSTSEMLDWDYHSEEISIENQHKIKAKLYTD